MRKLFTAALVGLVVMAAGSWSPGPRAATEIVSAPAQKVTLPYTVFLASHQYVNVTSTTGQALADLSALLVDNPSTNNANIYGHLGRCASTSVSTQAIRGPLEISPSGGTVEIRAASDVCVWMMSAYTVSGETITVQAVTQFRR